MAMYSVPITKAKQSISVDSTTISDELCEYIFFIGLKTVLNRGTSKLNKKEFPDEAEYASKALVVAEEQLAMLHQGKTRKTGVAAASKGKSSPEQTMALELAKKDAISQLRASGLKVSLISAKDKTVAGKLIFDADPERYLSAARHALSKLGAPTPGVDLAAMVKEDEGLKKKAAKASAERAAEAKAKKEGKAPPAKAKPAKPQARAQH